MGMPAGELKVLGVTPREFVTDVRQGDNMPLPVRRRVVTRLFDFNSDDEVELLPAFIVRRPVGDVRLGGRKPLVNFFIRASITLTLCLKALRKSAGFL